MTSNVAQPGLCFLCQRCGAAVLEPHADPETALRRAIEANQLYTMHACGTGTGLARLIGTATTHATVADMLEAGRART